MNRHEEDQYPGQQMAELMISQEQPKPRLLTQIIAFAVFMGFIILTPTIIDRLGK